MMKQKDPTPCYGQRDESFKSLIHGLLVKANLKKKYIAMFTDDSAMEIYNSVFTHKSIDAENNYEHYEILGDGTITKFLIWYFSERFPKIATSSGVKVLAQLRIKYGSKIMLAPIAEEYGFTKYISATKGEFDVSKTSLLEDVFEAFIGATELLVNTRIKKHVGYSVCYTLLQTLYDAKPIDISYEALNSPISRLKEIFDRPDIQAKLHVVQRPNKNRIEYICRIVEDKICESYVCYSSSDSRSDIILATARGSSKVASENNAAIVALGILAKSGITDEEKSKAYNNLFN